MSLCLTKGELVELTDCKHRVKQIEVLVNMDIPFQIAPTGAIKVLWSDLEEGSIQTTKQSAWRSWALEAMVQESRNHRR